MRVSIHQPNYIPWMGFFKKISMCDIFVFFDNVQMPMNKSFVSRNKILANKVPLWLTVPIKRKGKQQIREVEIADQMWIKKHLKTIEVSYNFSDYYEQIITNFITILNKKHKYISDLNIEIITTIWKILDDKPKKFIRASEMNLQTYGSESILEILEKLNTKVYITGSGEGTKRYLDVNAYKEKNIMVKFCPDDFPKYKQKDRTYIPNLSILDVLFNIGPQNTRKLLVKV